MSRGGAYHYRCVLSVIKYLLKLDGLSDDQVSMVLENISLDVGKLFT